MLRACRAGVRHSCSPRRNEELNRTERLTMNETSICRGLLRLTALPVLAAALALATLAGSTAAAAATPRHTPSAAPVPLSTQVASEAKLINVGGVSVNVLCTGPTSAKPTIVLIAGQLDALTKFAALQATLSQTNRVCSYDRPGEGASPSPSAPQSLSGAATLLNGVLNVEHVGKVTIVGHSLGGLVAATFAHRYPARVKAVVLLDTPAPSTGRAILSLIPATPTGVFAAIRNEVNSLSSASLNTEKLVYHGQPLGSLGSIPLTVAEHGQPIYASVPTFGARLQTIWSRGEEQLAQLSSNSRMIIARKSGHYIYLDQQALTVQLIHRAGSV
jgi:pimeloyl-ACP methyl ester carboxylesterase